MAVTLDVGKVLTTVGIEVSVGGTVIAWAHDYDDLGGTPAGLDATPLSSKVQIEKAGIQETSQWNLQYYFNVEDFNTLETKRKSKESTEIIVKFPDGVQFKNNGVCAGNYAAAGSVNSVANATATFNLSNPDGWEMTEAE